jgi:flagellar protein FliO/FliZ
VNLLLRIDPPAISARRARSLTSGNRWLPVVIGCVVLAMAQPMSAASPESTAEPARAADTIIYPKASPGKDSPLPRSDSDGSRGPVLVVALLLAGTGAWVLLQRRKTGALTGKGSRKLQVEETRPLGNRQYLIVAEYEGKRFLLGVTPGQIQMLTPLDGPGPASPKPETKP